MIKLKYTDTIDVAIGRNRREKNWKIKEYDWAAFVTRVSKTHRTHEAHSAYMAMKRTDQDEIKDIGGFVGGRLAGSRRKAHAVLYRQLVTLDLDFVKPDFQDELNLAFNNAACVYSTHKHSPEAPRLRLIMPLDRPVKPDEYEAIARKIAGILDIEIFDPTTFQPERLMFWPSTAKDGAFEFFYHDAPFLCADDILGLYYDWTDSSDWPVSTKLDKVVRRDMKKQGDPLEKNNMVGVFCRTHTIHEAIEKYLPDYYEEGTIEDRYTYLEGSTSNGLITYDDKFAYSHHGTDPVSMKLVNAFDIVRIHLFGLQDDNVKEDTPPNRVPSFASMLELCMKDKAVKKQLNSERLDKAREDFADMIDLDDESEEVEYEAADIGEGKTEYTKKDKSKKSADPDAPDWSEKLEIDKQGKCLSTIQNVAIILNNDPKLKGRFIFNAFTQRKELAKSMPWRKVDKTDNFLRDDDEQNLNKYLEKYYNITSRLNIKDALDTHYAANYYHPVRNYINGLIWDGIPRLDTLLIEYLGAEDTDYTRAVTRKTLVAAVARIFRPGCKFDNVLTLVGEEGKGKSTIISKLGGAWFSDSFNFSMLHTKEAVEQLQGVWIIELGELVGLKKADQDAIKGYIAKCVDIYRKAFGKNTIPYKRQCIFIGSTNNWDFLRGANGNRRWWPIDILFQKPTRDVFSQLDSEEVGQIWAEAKELFDSGEALHLDTELEQVAREVQKNHLEVDDRIGIINKYLDTLLPEDWTELNTWERITFLSGSQDGDEREGVTERTRVCIPEIWTEAFKGDYKTMTRFNVKELHDIMRNLDGWKPYKSKTNFVGFGTQRGYYRDSSRRHFLGEKTAVTKYSKN